MKNTTAARLCLLLLATAIGLCLAIHCRAQGFPPVVPDARQQVFAYRDSLTFVRKTLTNVRDSIRLLNTRVDTLIAADKRVRIALKAEADAAAAGANARLMNVAVQLAKANSMRSAATTRAEKAEAESSRYRPRTWAGRQLRHVWNAAAYVGLGSVGYVVLRVLVLR